MKFRHVQAHRRRRLFCFPPLATSPVSFYVFVSSLLVYMIIMHRIATTSLKNCAQSGIPGPGSTSHSSPSIEYTRNKPEMNATFAPKNDNLRPSQCQSEYDRLTTHQTPGLTKQDLIRSQAWTGNQNRIVQMMKKLSSRERPVVAVVAGGSISLGHGVTPDSVRYAERLQTWMNDMFPLEDKNNKHQVINVAAHGADMCSMGKRLNILYSDLSSRMPTSSKDEPDLIILEFGVNDYQGQDHLITIDHKTSVFFDGFRDLILCAEVVIHSLLNKYPNAAVVFLEMQTAIVTRKTGSLLHLGVAQHYQIPVISYSEAMFPDFFRLIHLLEGMNNESAINGRLEGTVTYSFKDEEWNLDNGLGNNMIAKNGQNVTQYASALLPYPHGCSPCQPQHIIPQFRAGGCKSICTFLERSGLIHNKKLKCNADQGHIPPGRSECFVPFFAHDAVHPSAAGHGIVTDLIVNTLATAELRTCKGEYFPRPDIMPLTTFVAENFEELKVRGDFIWVHDVARIFAKWDALNPVQNVVGTNESGNTPGFQLFADDNLKQRPGWISTNPAGGENITFALDLTPNQCYVVYLATLRSYNLGMGTMTVEVRDYGDKRDGTFNLKTTTTKKIDSLWSAPISVWSDVQVTQDGTPGCTGFCEVTVTTDPLVVGRNGNKVKLLTLSARRCSHYHETTLH